MKRLPPFVEVPAVHSWWVRNFIFHWTFATEIAICMAAVVVWIRKRRNGTLAV